ncbi:hypothetical protein F5Y19DRAFT_471287 [Xylariaceae sp. FL1651]|nr:hypothetical protein F5Y19DRAFT_471287 [Xylariaceae sp. FL1651]
MADYTSLKVPELKKLLQEKQLPVTGNKADLIARLQEHDKANEEPKLAAPVSAEEDPIDYSDDDVPATNEPEAAAEPVPAEQKTAKATAATEPTAEDAAPGSGEGKPAEAGAVKDDAEPAGAAAEAEAAAPKTDFSAHLPASTADDEARKRAERAKRFGIVEDANEEAKKKSERAERFGLDQASLPSGLDAALPEKRERKRGREGGAAAAQADGERGPKRQQNGPGRRRGGRDHRGRGGRQGGGDRGDRRDRGGAPRREGGGGGGDGGDRKPRGILNDAAERAKAEARAKRFGGGA